MGANRIRAGIVGRSRQLHVSIEIRQHLRQVQRTAVDVLRRIVCVRHGQRGLRIRHQLHQPLRALGRAGVGAVSGLGMDDRANQRGIYRVPLSGGANFSGEGAGVQRHVLPVHLPAGGVGGVTGKIEGLEVADTFGLDVGVVDDAVGVGVLVDLRTTLTGQPRGQRYHKQRNGHWHFLVPAFPCSVHVHHPWWAGTPARPIPRCGARIGAPVRPILN